LVAIPASPPRCPACGRPVASAGPACLYCAAPLPPEIRSAAALSAERILASRDLRDLEARGADANADPDAGGGSPPRPVIIDTLSTDPARLAEACGIAPWEARQWQLRSRYRLLRLAPDPEAQALIAQLKAAGVDAQALDSAATARARTPMRVLTLADEVVPFEASLQGSDAARVLRVGPEERLALVIMAAIRRERAADPAQIKRAETLRLEDFLVIHLHFRGESAPWEIDARTTGFEGGGSVSAHMRLLALVRRLGEFTEVDDSFRHVVPALAPATPLEDETPLRRAEKRDGRKPEARTLFDNLTQFRQYSAWRGALAVLVPQESANR